ncbi:hypothetical protein [Mesorhizobium sp. M0895]|uniref:hypothetical protein n=1 Tax=Mesorhizobium sp. M0895 TaxID=2957019 RepID=UPI00333BD220
MTNRITFDTVQSVPTLFFVAASKAMRNLFDLTKVSGGWLYGKGNKADWQTLVRAAYVTAEMQKGNFSDFEFFPDESGGVMISASSEDGCIEIFCRVDGHFDIYLDEMPGADKTPKINLTFSHVINFLQERSWHPPSLSYFSVHCTIAKRNADTSGWHLKTRPAVAFQSWSQTVPLVQPDQFVVTSPPTTLLASQDRPYHFGEYRPDIFATTSNSYKKQPTRETIVTSTS